MNGCSRSCVQLAEIEAMRSMTHAGRQKDNQANDRAGLRPGEIFLSLNGMLSLFDAA
jgi:hypothetical protein